MNDKTVSLINNLTAAIINENRNKLSEFNHWYDDIANNRISSLQNVFEDIKLSQTNLRNDYNSHLKKYTTLQNEMQISEKTVKNTKDEFEKQMKELSLAKKECNKFFNKCEKVKKSKDMTAQEKNLLETTKLEFNMYAKLTNVKWDFTNQDTKSIRGYVRDKTTGKSKIFNYNCNEMTHEEIGESLWNDVDTIEDDWFDRAADKENQSVN